MADNKAFLGTGMKFPPTINPATGRFETVSGPQAIKESIYIILMTQKKERRPRPGFGSHLMSYTFSDTNTTLLSIMGREIMNDIRANEPRVSNVNVDVVPNLDKNCLVINITYTISESNTRDNLVFPFYLDTMVEKDEENMYAEPEEI